MSATCQLKHIERMAPRLEFALRPANIMLHGDDKGVPPMMQRIGFRVDVCTSLREPSDTAMRKGHEMRPASAERSRSEADRLSDA